MIEAGEDRVRLLLENSMTDFAGSTFQQCAHTFLGRLHMKLQGKNALANCKSLRLCNFTLGEQLCAVRQIECLAMPVKWSKAIG